MSSELFYKSNTAQVSMVYRLINYLGSCKSTQRIRKSLDRLRPVIYEFFSCSSNFLRGLSASKPYNIKGVSFSRNCGAVLV